MSEFYLYDDTDIKSDIFSQLETIRSLQLRIEGHFGFLTFWTKFCDILKYRMTLTLEIIVKFFREIIKLNAVNIYQRHIKKYNLKMALCPPMSTVRVASVDSLVGEGEVIQLHSNKPAAKRSAHVAPEVNLRERTLRSTPQCELVSPLWL